MGNVLLCTGKYAQRPYHFENICANVYCVEELCYLLAANPFMIDADIMNAALARWVDEECGLLELSHQLLNLLGKGTQPGVFVNTILDYVGYNTEKERKKINDVLKGSIGLSEHEKWKKQGDYLLKNERYRLAIIEYDKMLLELPEGQDEMKADIYHNMAVAYSRLFQYETASRFFKKAYELSGKEASGISYLAAVRSQMKEGEYITFIAENGQYYELSMKLEKVYNEARVSFEGTEQCRRLSALEIFRDEGNTASYYEEMDKMIGQLKNEYRQSVSK